MCDLSADLRVRVRLALLDLSGDRPPLPRAGGDGLREDEDEELELLLLPLRCWCCCPRKGLSGGSCLILTPPPPPPPNAEEEPDEVFSPVSLFCSGTEFAPVPGGCRLGLPPPPCACEGGGACCVCC